MSSAHRYHVSARPSGPEVLVWSDFAPPFEPAGDAVSLRDEIRSAVRPLSCSRGEMLDAAYFYAGRDISDAENVLFYNIGAAYFSMAARDAIRFTRVYADPPACPDGRERMVHLRYAVSQAGAPSDYWKADASPAAQWTRVALDLGDGRRAPSAATKAGLYWLALKRASPSLGTAMPDGPFALDLQLHAPRGFGRALNLTGIIKPLVDGVVAAHHHHTRPISEHAIAHLQRQLGRGSPDVAALHAMLRDETRAVLGGRRDLVMPKGLALWNPRDNDCVSCRLQVADSGEPGWALSGSLARATETAAP